MNIPDEAVEAAARNVWINSMLYPWEQAAPHLVAEFRHNARLALEAAAPHLTQPRTVTTAEELDALEVGAVVRGKWLAEKWATPEGDVWFIAGRNMEWFTDDLVMRAGLPATVLHEGGKS